MSGQMPSKATTTPLVAEVFENIFATELEKHECKNVLEEHVNTVFEKVPQKSQEKIFVIAKQGSSTDHIIGRIEYIFENHNKMFAHITLLMHGTHTVLSCTSEVGELFLLNKCADIYVKNIIRKIDVNYINPSEDEMHRYYQYCNRKNSCFYMFNWNEEFFRYETLDNSDIAFDNKNPIQICSNCTKEDLYIKSKNPETLEFLEESKGIYYFYNFNLCNEVYKIGSFVYLPPGFNLSTLDEDENNVESDDDEYEDFEVFDPKIYPEYYRTNSHRGSNKHTVDSIFDIGEITAIFVRKNNKRNVRAIVRLMYRPEKTAFQNDDMNMVFWSEDKFEIECSIIVGKCYVSHIMNIKDTISWSAEGPDRFYFKNGYNNNENLVIPEYKLSCEAKLTGCEVAVEYNYDFVDEHKIQLIPSYKKVSPLIGIDLYAGCGGLTEGLQNSGCVTVKWAVEMNFNAAKAFNLNHPNTLVFNDDCNKLLKSILSGKITNSKSQKLPVKGEVDIIFGGPPCQGISGVNRFNYTNKSMRLNALTATFMSYIDYYRPKFFVIENVKNFVTHDGGIFLSSTIKCIIKMGYQSTFTILQAGNFGVPQNRRRFILIGAAPGETLPVFPKPKHAFNKKFSSLNIKLAGKMYNNNCENKGCAPMRSVTVDEALSDLPIIRNGWNEDILEYQKQPLTSFQKSMRFPNKLFSNSIVTEHICKTVSPLMEGRIRLLKEGQDWRYLPNIQVELSDGTVTKILKYNHYDKKNGNGPDGAFRGVCPCVTDKSNKCDKKKKQKETLIPYSVSHTANNNNNWVGVVGRLKSNGYFPTITQNPDPLGKVGTVIHYQQPRILSTREMSRGQGFNDEYKLYGPINSKYSQIGNAVSPPMAKAIGDEIIKAILK